MTYLERRQLVFLLKSKPVSDSWAADGHLWQRCRWALRETLKQISMLINNWHVQTFCHLPKQTQTFVTTSTKHSSDLQPGLPLKSGGSPQQWWFIFISGRCKCLRMHGGTVNHYKVGEAMVSISPSVFITGGITYTDLKLCVSAGTQGRGKWMGITLLRLKASGHVCLFHAWTHFSKLASAKYDKGQRRPYYRKKKHLEDKIWLSASKKLLPRANDG